MAHTVPAWVLSKGEVTAPIVGVSKLQHLRDALATPELKLSDDKIHRLEAPSIFQRSVAF